MGTFEEGEVGRFIPGNDRTYAGSVPGSAFASGPTGGERTKAWLKAGEGNPEMLNGIKDMAINELHGMTEDGLVTPKDLKKWKTRYGSALSAIDEVEPGFSNRFDAHAAEQQKLLDVTKAGDTAKKTFSKTELAKFLGYEDPAEVDKHIAGLMGDKVGAIKLRRLMADMNGNVEAQEGLRTAVVNHLMERARSDTLVPGPGGEPINASAPGKYLKALNDGRPQLEAVFGPDGYDAAKRVAEEMTRTKAAIDARLTGGSDSAKNLVQFLKESGEGGGHSAAMSTAEGFAIFETIKELSHGVLNQDPMALAKAGMLVAGRFGLHAWQEQLARKRGIAMKEEGDVIREALLDPGYGHSLLERGSSRAQAHAPMDLRDRVQKAQVMGTAADREAHASGGSVGVDHAAHAARMVREVSKLRDQLGKTTKPFLNMHDNKIAAALQIAREAAQ